MHQTFGAKVPRLEQLMRVSWAKKPGRKHQHRMGPGKVANRATTHRVNTAAHRVEKKRRYTQQVRAYWIGERDCHP